MESREEILANFQACTGIEDIGIALQFLEESNWVLVDAVNKSLPAPVGPQAGDAGQDRAVSPPPPLPLLNPDAEPIMIADDDDSPTFPQMEPPGQQVFQDYLSSPNTGGADVTGSVSNRAVAGVSIASDFLPSFPSTSNRRYVDLHIEYRDKLIHLKVPDDQTIRTVKDLIQEQTNVPPCQQEIRGWSGNSHVIPTDRRVLSELNLPKENFLYLLTPDVASASMNTSEQPTEENKIVLNVKDALHDKMYTLTFSETTIVSTVKRDVATVTGIPVFKQAWTGWPDGTHDDLSLAQCSVQNLQQVTVNQVQPEANLNMPIVIDEDSEAEVSDTEIAGHDAEVMVDDEDIFNGGHSPRSGLRGIHPLLPDDFGDESLAGIKFGEEFSNRYGHPSPQFFPGSLEDALADSCNTRSSSERKLLALYLHHDHSVLTNIFCTQVLCADAVIGLLNEHFVTWGWDLTFSSNKNRLLDMINRHFGSIAASTLRNFSLEKFPVVIIIARVKANIEIVKMIHGNTSLMEFMTEVLQATESYTQQLGVEQREERDRNEANYLKEEQERAFQEAQMLDQVKEREREDAEAEAALQQQIDDAKKKSEIEAKQKEEREARMEQDEAKTLLPDEPAADNPLPLANIKFRAPQQMITRRFFATDKLSTLLLYLTSIGYKPENFKVLSSWPRRDISELDPQSTLAQLKLTPQETLTLESRRTDESDSE